MTSPPERTDRPGGPTPNVPRQDGRRRRDGADLTDAARPDLQDIGEQTDQARLLAVLTVVALAALLLGWYLERSGAGLAALVAFLIAYGTGGYSGAVNGWEALRERRLNVDVLMLVAAAGAAAIGEWLEGGVLLFLFSLSETLQTMALGRTESAIRSLMGLRPDTATRIRSDGTDERVDVEDLSPGDRVRVLPGERIPVDGELLEGDSEIDQAAITGESVPVYKGPGDPVFAATINGPGVLQMRVTRRAEDSTLARIVRLVAEAQATRAPTQRFIDRFGDRYAWLVIAGSVAMMTIPTAVLGWPFEAAFYRAMTLLVVASPCALVISTPASYLSAIANAARNGVLFKGGAYLESAAAIDVVALDKTGTLTTGHLQVTDVVPIGDVTEAELLAVSAAVERHSEHHIARAVASHAEAQGVRELAATAVRALPGLGIRAHVEGRRITIASPRLHRREGGVPSDARSVVERLEGQGKTTMVVSVATDAKGPATEVLGVIAVADKVRPEAAPSLEALRRAGIDRLVMVTGDNAAVAAAVADMVGIEPGEVRADLMPESKVRVVEELAASGSVAFVGDGVNDAPAMATSSLGIAMGGGGTDAALETADVVLMADRLDRLVHVFALGRAARQIVRQNIAISVGVMAVLVATTVLVGLDLPLGVVGHEGSTVLVVLNGLRLLGFKAPVGSAGDRLHRQGIAPSLATQPAGEPAKGQ